MLASRVAVCVHSCDDSTLLRFGHRVTELPPGVAHLTLAHCHLDALMLPAGLQLHSLHLKCSNLPRMARRISRGPLSLLTWLEKAQPQAAVRMFGMELAQDALSMEQYAKRLSELATCSVDMWMCTLYNPDNSESTDSVTDVARHMEQHYGRRVTVKYTRGEKCCRIERVGEVH